MTAFVSLIAGASLGPEAPLADACGGIGTWASDRLKLDQNETAPVVAVAVLVSALLTSFLARREARRAGTPTKPDLEMVHE